jgi:hypothetical protein
MEIIMKRYYKYIFPNVTILKVQFWFNVHRILMVFALICSIISFIVILADLKWKWIELTDMQVVNFAHSISGIFVIGFSVIQVKNFICLFLKAEKNYLFTSIFQILRLSWASQDLIKNTLNVLYSIMLTVPSEYLHLLSQVFEFS